MAFFNNIMVCQGSEKQHIRTKPTSQTKNKNFSPPKASNLTSNIQAQGIS